jgi:hypothetical protein
MQLSTCLCLSHHVLGTVESMHPPSSPAKLLNSCQPQNTRHPPLPRQHRLILTCTAAPCTPDPLPSPCQHILSVRRTPTFPHSRTPAPHQVGLLDIDICGPSAPKLTGLEGEEVHQSGSGWSPVYVQDNLAVMSIGGWGSGVCGLVQSLWGTALAVALAVGRVAVMSIGGSGREVFQSCP